MNEPVARICLLLATSNERSNDLRSFARWIEQVGPHGLVNAIERIRDAADLFTKEPTLNSSRAERHIVDRSAESSNRQEVIAKIQELLFKDGGLSKSAAAEILFERLAIELGGTDRLPIPQKVAFETWLGRVLDRTPESVVLHVVTRIRNEITKERLRSDWALKKGAE
jgi:hypothetical protein